MELNDAWGLVSLSDLAMATASGGFSSELFSIPIGPGSIVLTASGDVAFSECCDKESKQQKTLLAGSVTVELFYRVGGNLPGKKNFKGRDRNVYVPHPCRLGEMIKLKRYNDALAQCRRERRNPWKNGGVSGGASTCDECPLDRWIIEGALFLRIKAGVGVGVELDGRYKFTKDQPLISKDNLAGSVKMGWGIGASVEAGGSVTATFNLCKF